jgi:transposase-like protein
MFVPRQQYSRELKIATMRELDSGKSVGEVARTYQVSPKRLERWQGEWRDRGEQLAFPGHAAPTQPKVDAQRIPERPGSPRGSSNSDQLTCSGVVRLLCPTVTVFSGAS